MLTDEKFYERAVKFNLFKNTDGKHFTLEEYKTLVSSEQTDKEGNLIYLYTNNPTEQHSYVEAAKAKGYDVLVLDGHLDPHFVNTLEQKNEKSRFVRVDSDIVEKLIVKSDANQHNLTSDQQNAMATVFSSQLPTIEKTNFLVTFENIGADAQPIIITQQEFMRRMKDMAAQGGGGMMGMYGDFPDSYNLAVNTAHPLIEKVLKAEEKACDKDVAPLNAQATELESRINELKASQKDKKEEEIPQAEKEEITELEKKTTELSKKKEAAISKFATKNKEVRQLIDLALLANNMLKGEALSKFVKRSVDIMKK
jgi:molecular chaperone HtpG